MEIKLTDEQLQGALTGAVQKGFEAAFSSWDFTHQVNEMVATNIQEKEIASKIGLHINKLLDEKHEEIIKGAVSQMMPAFEKCFDAAIQQTIRRMLVGMHLNINENNKYLSDEIKDAIKKVDSL